MGGLEGDRTAAPAAGAPVLRCENLTLRAGGQEIVRDLSFSARPGDKILLYGPSGSGKSSIVKALLGFMPIAEGTFYYRGAPVSERDFWTVRREVGYVPQNPDIGEGSLRSLVDSVFSFQANPSRPSDERIEELFRIFGLDPDHLTKNFSDLSGGEKQRAALALVLLLDRDILFLDEITSALDGEMKLKVVDYILGLEAVTRLIISHDDEWKRSGGLTVVPLELPAAAAQAGGAP